MSGYITSKKVRYITSIVFVLFMAIIVGGSILFQSEKANSEATSNSLNHF